jgi:1,4-dihydroxy-2-naphthoate octaprenyltransferase
MERTRSTTQAQAWLLASRPRTLTAAIVPVMVGSALAWRDGVFQPWAALAALLAAVLIQIGTNFANDVHDFKKGADTAARLGPTRVTSAGLLTPKQVEAGMLVVFGAAVLLGLYLIYVGVADFADRRPFHSRRPGLHGRAIPAGL